MDNKIDLSNSRNKTLVVDIDEVLAVDNSRIPISRRLVVNEAVESIRLLRQKGFRIILHTSRSKFQAAETIMWLNENKIEFDGIKFGKPRGILYIDDRGYRFNGWKKFFEDVNI
jgi:hydroxymethylpyrimidine pyrophosphatase-like HAD family hydrolase